MYLLLIVKERRGVKRGKFPKCSWPRYFPPRRTGLGLKGAGTVVLLSLPGWPNSRPAKRLPLCVLLAFFSIAPGAPGSPNPQAARDSGCRAWAARPALLPSSLPRPSPTFLKAAGPSEEAEPRPRSGSMGPSNWFLRDPNCGAFAFASHLLERKKVSLPFLHPSKLLPAALRIKLTWNTSAEENQIGSCPCGKARCRRDAKIEK